ncbi:MAG: hypothetical protein JWP97_3210 [Labilithrix sp.]|nr:hypothetical protein [Labilithrix sp.]
MTSLLVCSPATAQPTGTPGGPPPASAAPGDPKPSHEEAAAAERAKDEATEKKEEDDKKADEKKDDKKKDDEKKKKDDDDVVLNGAPPKEQDERKPMDYGGPPRETDAGDVLVWPARVVLFPLFIVNDIILRRPLGALVKAAESGQWIEEVTSFFTFGERKQIVVFPSALFDFGLKPSVGFNASWKYFGAEHNTARLHFGTWGPNWISVKGSDTYDLSKTQRVYFEGSLVRRRDNPYFGYGPRSTQDDRARYQSTASELALGYTHDFWRSSTFAARAGSRTLLFQEGTCCGEDAVETALEQHRFTAPGYGRGYVAGFQRVDFEIDSRRPRPEPGGGIRVEAHEETVFPVDAETGAAKRSWVKYGGSVGAAVDLTGTQRVLGLTLATELIDPIQGSGNDIPFPDQVTLGGDNWMPGYLRGRLYGRSSVVGQLQYRWPIWVFLDGVVHAALGNVYGAGYEGFDVKSSRLSTGLGVRSNGERDSGFELLFAIGSDPLDEGFAVSSFRLVFGSHHGF